MRRTRILTATVAALAVVALSGCGATDDAGSDAHSDDADLLPAAEGATNYPLVLETPYGETTLEERPERIAVIGGLGDMEATLALGIAPVVGSDEVEYLWLDGTRFDDIDQFVNPWADAFAYETLLAAEPDLIIASTYGDLQDGYERLSTIAPVLAVAPIGDYAWDWRELTRAVGAATDLADRAEDEIAKTEQYVIDADAAHPEYDDKTVAIIINRGQEAGIEFVNIADSPAETMLGELGFAPHPQVDALSAFEWGEVSLENIGLIDADALLVARHGGDGTIDEATSWLEGNALYQSLSAVQAGKVEYLDPNPQTEVLDLAWAFSYPNALSIRWTVDALNDAFDGLFD